MEVVLGHPYSGALLAYFSDELGGIHSHTNVASTHSYYRTLYGKGYVHYVELALTFMLLYDTVWITPADNHMPTSRLNPGDRSFIPELGLHADWDDFRPNGGSQRDSHINRYLLDSQLCHILGRRLQLPKNSWHLIVDSAIYEAGLSATKRCPLLCSPGRRAIIERLIEIDRPSLHPVFANSGKIQFVESYRKFTGMALRPQSLESLMEVKSDRDIRAYGAAFLAIATEQQQMSERDSQVQMARLMREAMETQKVASHFSGALNWASRLFRFADMSLIGTMASGGSFAASCIASNAGWYEFSGKIDNAINQARFRENIEKVLKQAERA